MRSFIAALFVLTLQTTLAAPLDPKDATRAAAATVGKIRGVREPIYHLYLQSNPKNCKSTPPHHITFPTTRPKLTNTYAVTASIPVLGPEANADEFTIGGTIQSKKTSLYLNIDTATTSYKPVSWGASGSTTAWGLEGDTIITVQGSSYGRREFFPIFVFLFPVVLLLWGGC